MGIEIQKSALPALFHFTRVRVAPQQHVIRQRLIQLSRRAKPCVKFFPAHGKFRASFLLTKEMQKKKNSGSSHVFKYLYLLGMLLPIATINKTEDPSVQYAGQGYVRVLNATKERLPIP